MGNGNPYYTEPANIMPGLQMLGKGIQRRAGFERERVKTAKDQKTRDEGAAILQKSPDEIAAWVAKTKGGAAIVKESLGARSDAMLDTAKRHLLGGEDAHDVLVEDTEKVIEEGGDASGAIDLLKRSQTDPSALTKKYEKVFAALDPAGYKSYMSQQGKGVVDKKGKPLKLTQLITKRNELPEDSPDRDLYDKAIAKEVAAPGQAKSHPFISKLMAEGWMPSGRITGPMLAAFEAAAEKANEMGKDLTVDDLRKMEFQAVKNRSTGSAAGSRLVLARKQGIESAQGLLKDMKVTAHKLNYSPVKFIGALEKYKKDQTGDPLFVEYMTQRADSLFILGNVLKQNGLTDKSIEVEEEAASPTLAPKAFDAWLNTQTRALNRAAKEMNTDYGYGITLLPAFDAGQAGAPTDEQPVPVLPPEGGHGQPPAQTQTPSLEDFISKAKGVNPGVGVQDLTFYWNKKYGGR